MNSEELKRDNFIDIVKAIGIISIVIGHSSWTITNYNIAIGPFVYTYHIMIFMFISGYLFNIKKAKENPNYKYLSFGKQALRFAKLYFTYGVIFVCLHNILLSLHIINGSNYGLMDILRNSLNSFTFSTSEILLGAFWFIPTMLIAKAMFTITYSDKNINKWYRFIPIVAGFAVLGIILCTKNIVLNYRMQISILAVPFMYLGVLTRKHWNIIQKYITSWAWIVCAIVIGLTIHITKSNIELSVNRLINPFIFYPISIVGIYFCLSLSKMINKIKHVNIAVSIVGKYSFHIMALHFLVIKSVDVIYSKMNGISNIEKITFFPNTYSKQLYMIYYILAVAIPTLIMIFIDKIKNKMIRR